jgi:hypothetical protein
LLFAAFPALFLFSQNTVQVVSINPLWLPLAVSVAAGTLTYVVMAGLLRSWIRGALAATLLIAAFFSFGHVARLIVATDTSRWWLVAAYLVVVGIGLVMIVRGGGFVIGVTRFANLAGFVLVVINVVGIVAFAVGVNRISGLQGVKPFETAVGATDRPDIYYIILDRYAEDETLQRVYGYDNREFLDGLEARGFSVAHDSWANYLKTASSLVSSLNADYLDVGQLSWGGPESFAPIHLALRGALAVPVTLKGLGYEYIHIGNYWEPGATNVDADESIRYGSESEFAAALLATTAWSLTEPVPAADVDPETIESPGLARANTLFEFDAIENAAQRPGPTYVFAHILVPHPPYVFNADGSEPTDDQIRSRSAEEAYVEQMKWTNKRISQLVDTLLSAPGGNEAVIVIQADEGPFPQRFAQDQANFNWLTATPEEVAQKFGILLAIHLPGDAAEDYGFTDRTSPVNVFRIVLNAVFRADLPLLPNRTFLTPDYHHLTTFVPYDRPQP